MSIDRLKILLTYLALLGALISLGSVTVGSSTLAQETPPYIRDVRIFDTGFPPLNAAGVAFSQQTGTFLLLADHTTNLPGAGPANLLQISPFEELAGSANLPPVASPINMAYDNRASQLLILDTATNELIEIEAGATDLDPAQITRFPAEPLGLQHPQGMAIDPASGHLFILDSAALRIVRVDPDPQHGYNPAAALAEGRISQVDLSQSDPGGFRGLAFNPANGHLYFLSPAELKLYEVTETGQLVATRDLANLDLSLRNPQGIVFAPSADLTDDPAAMHLFLVDSGREPTAAGPYLPIVGVQQGQEAIAPLEAPPAVGAATEGNAVAPRPGRIIEFSLTPPVQSRSSFSAMAVVATLIQTIDASQWSPPSPDPTGIAYLPHRGTLLVSDSEVNEMPIFTGDNLFEASLSGSLAGTFTTISFSDEPTGIDVNPANRHLFFSDDTGTRSVYELNPGPDGLYNTADDSVTSFKTADFGNSDPEGLAYDPGSGALFIVDGVNREIYRVHPGANGIFDGVPPVGDDQASNFDTLSLGLDDPEGIAFNADSGTLYAVGDPADTLFELTTGGALVQTIDISAADARTPAGLALGPGSQNPGKTSIYIVDRGVDNDSDPNENDGKIYEFSLPGAGETTLFFPLVMKR